VYPDEDEDGFGDGSAPIYACSNVAGTVPNGDDCNDASAATWPGAEELCDGIDNDCDDLPDPNSCRPLDSADGRMDGADADGQLGFSVAGPGDLDGDGRADVLVGAPGVEPGGVAYLFSGPVLVALTPTTAKAAFFGKSIGDDAGYSVSGAGDLDLDGYADLAIGARGENTTGDGAGAIYLLSGPLSGDYGEEHATAILYGETAGDAAGIGLAAAGDTNGDGQPDLLVGAPNDSDVAINAGSAYLLLGPLSGPINLSTAAAKLTGEFDSDYAAQRLDGGGDLNGDGLDDIVVAAYSSDRSASGAGAVYVFEGPVVGERSLSEAAAILTGKAEGDHVGQALRLAPDLDLDGYDDLLIGAPDQGDGGTGAGAAYLMRGPLTGEHSVTEAAAVLIGRAEWDHAGNAVDAPGDVNGDGQPDVLVGAYIEDSGGLNAGAAYLMHGPLEGTAYLKTAQAGFIGEVDGDNAGWSVAALGDSDGDGLSDLLIGAPGHDNLADNAGAAYFIGSIGLAD
jgi:hypothetical protein